MLIDNPGNLATLIQHLLQTTAPICNTKLTSRNEQSRLNFWRVAENVPIVNRTRAQNVFTRFQLKGLSLSYCRGVSRAENAHSKRMQNWFSFGNGKQSFWRNFVGNSFLYHWFVLISSIWLWINDWILTFNDVIFRLVYF